MGIFEDGVGYRLLLFGNRIEVPLLHTDFFLTTEMV